MRLCGSLMVIIAVGSLIMAGESDAAQSRVLLPVRHELVRSASHKCVLVNISRWKDEFGEEPSEASLLTFEFTHKQLTFLNTLLEQASQKAQFDVLDNHSIPELCTLYAKLKAKNSQTLSPLFLKALVRVMSQKARQCKRFEEVEKLVSATRFDQTTLKELWEWIPPMSLSGEPSSNGGLEDAECKITTSVLRDPKYVDEDMIRRGYIFEPRISVCYDKELDVLVRHRQAGSVERVYRQGKQRLIFGFLEKDLLCRIDPVTREPLWSYHLKHRPAVLAFDWNAEGLIAFSSERITMLDVQMGVPIIDGMPTNVPIAAVLLERRKQMGREVERKVLLRGNNGSSWRYLLETRCTRGWLACWLRSQYLDQNTRPFCSQSKRNLRAIFKDCS